MQASPFAKDLRLIACVSIVLFPDQLRKIYDGES